MPLELPQGWTSLPAPKGLNLTRKWERVKDARLPLAMKASSSVEAMAIAKQMVKYCREPTSTDNWLLPNETLKLGAGDCEDWCLFVRALLINGGINPSTLWLLIVHDLATKQDHALLWTAIRYCDGRAPGPLTHDKFMDYRPIAAFNDREAVVFGRRV